MVSNVNKIAKTSFLLMLGNVLGHSFSLLRNAILGHFLSPQDFGIAATFAVTVSFLEVVGDMGSDKLLVQAKDGNDIRLQSSAQSFAVLRGIMSSIFLLIAAPYVTMLFNIPQAESAFFLLALVPFIRGFIHLDVKRIQRELRFIPNMLAELIPQFISCLLAFPIVFIRADYSAAIILILLQSLLLVLMTHQLANRGYKISFDRSFFKRMLKFGWPLMINGSLMFFVYQSDKFIIGSYYDIEKLGVYSAAFMLTMAPALLMSKVLNTVILPLFSKNQDDHGRLNASYMHATEITVLIASAYTVLFALFGGAALALVFGKHFQGNAELMAALGILWSLRTLRVPATLLAMSKGYTKVGLTANIFRSFAIIGVFYFSIRQSPIELIAYVGCAGELLAVLVTLIQIKKIYGRQYRLFSINIWLFIFSVTTSMFYIFYCSNNFANMLITSFAFIFLFSLIALSIYRKLADFEKLPLRQL